MESESFIPYPFLEQEIATRFIEKVIEVIINCDLYIFLSIQS